MQKNEIIKKYILLLPIEHQGQFVFDILDDNEQLEQAPVINNDEKKQNKKRAIKCSKCGTPGHQSRKCTKKDVFDEEDDKKEAELVKDIKRLFVDEQFSSKEVCMALDITLQKFNQIVIDNDIVRN